MKSYTIEFNGSGEVLENHFASDDAAILWAESVLTQRGYEPDDLVCGDWDADGENDEGQQCWKMLFWENEQASENDPGANSVCQLCAVR